MLNGKKILLGVSGGIAAYKAAVLVRLLVKAGAQVRVVMTPSAKQFITPLTLSTLSKHPVLTDLTGGAEGEWNNHVELGLWADLMLVAPATANTLAKFANGLCDNLLTACYLSARCPVILAPAMDVDMYKHPATQRNLERLRTDSCTVIRPGTGELASGLHGEGRLAEPEEIIGFLEATLAAGQRLKGKHILVTAGPTYEAIDPVRFIGNHSSGKMGFALAEALASAGAKVTLVAGPGSQTVSHSGIRRIDVTSAHEMYEASLKAFASADAAILAAAVADYRPRKTAKTKIKKDQGGLRLIELEETEDILATLGKKKKKKQVLAGFALETDNELANAAAKLKRKHLDFIVLNSLRDKGAGFQTDTNRVTILTAKGKTLKFDLKPKTAVAADIVDHLASYF